MNPPSISRTDASRGSALILFIGVAAALSILALGLITLVMNTQASTAKERQRSKAFNVAEAALDVAMEELGHRWPTSATTTTWFNAAGFAQRFPVAEFPDAANPQSFVQVRLTDDNDASKSFDYDGDGVVFVDAQARVGAKAARVHAQVEAIYYPVDSIRGLALWTGGDVTSNGGDPKVTVEVFPPGGTDCSWAAKGVADASVGASYMNLLQGGDAPERNEVLSDAKIAELITLAQSTGRYFTSVNAPATTPESYGGLCVINAGPDQQVKLTGGAIYNSEDQPGALLVLGGASLQFGGNTQYFGLIYCVGSVGEENVAGSQGTAIIHGMIVTEGGFLGGGTPDIRYNDKCVRGLDKQFPVGSRLVPGYWRELTPTI